MLSHRALADVVADQTPPQACASRDAQFLRFVAPLALFIAATDFNQSAGHHPLTRLYIAQVPLEDLPPELRDDVGLPLTVRRTGRGDMYSSSLWLGLEPTATPWHCDPNPNMFFQLCNAKVVRMALPRIGETVFRQTKLQLGMTASLRIRGEEMMAGPERDLLDDAIWTRPSQDLVEAHLDAGDALFIPKGWWHSVKSAGSAGGTERLSQLVVPLSTTGHRQATCSRHRQATWAIARHRVGEDALFIVFLPIHRGIVVLPIPPWYCRSAYSVSTVVVPPRLQEHQEERRQGPLSRQSAGSRQTTARSPARDIRRSQPAGPPADQQRLVLVCGNQSVGASVGISARAATAARMGRRAC